MQEVAADTRFISVPAVTSKRNPFSFSPGVLSISTTLVLPSPSRGDSLSPPGSPASPTSPTLPSSSPRRGHRSSRFSSLTSSSSACSIIESSTHFSSLRWVPRPTSNVGILVSAHHSMKRKCLDEDD